MPNFEQSVMPARWGDSIECDEVWAYVGTKQNPQWIWLSWSFQTTQTLSFAVGPRNVSTGKTMFEAIPKSYSRKQVYTDGCDLYDHFIAWWRHWVCPKGSGDTCIAEGCNNYLRHRVSYLVRESPSFARKVEWLERRLLWVLYQRNERIKELWASTRKTT